MSIRQALYYFCWLLTDKNACTREEDRKNLITIAGLGLLLLGTLTHGTG